MFKVNLKAALAAATVGLAGLMAASGANAFPIYSPVTGFEDDNLEYMNVDINGNGMLDVGDRLRGVVEFTKIFGVFGGGFQAPSPELTGLFELEVATKTIGNVSPTGVQLYNYVFKPTASFEAIYGAGAMIALFEGGSNLDVITPNCGAIAACESLATDGTKVLVVGYGDADDVWSTFDARQDVLNLIGVPASTKVGVSNYFLSILENNTPYSYGQQSIAALTGGVCAAGGDCLVDVIGSGDSLGGQGLGNGYYIRSDIDAQIAFIPEPSGIALAGVALAGLGLVSRRRKASKR